MSKGLISMRHFEGDGLDEWLQTNGLKCYQDNFKGFSSEDVREYAELVLSSELSTDELENALTSIVQFPLFTAGLVPGTSNFKHELVAEYLAAKWFVNTLRIDPTKAAKAIGERLDFSDSMVCRYITKEISEDREAKNRVENAVRAHTLSGRHFAHLVQILAVVDRENEIFRKLHLDKSDLRCVVFENVNFGSVSFCNADLSRTRVCFLQSSRC